MCTPLTSPLSVPSSPSPVGIMECCCADSCMEGKVEGACNLPLAQEFCPVTCELPCCIPRASILCISTTCDCASAAELPLPSAWSWCKKATTFCLSSSQSCDVSSVCGNRLRSAEECKEAAIELLGTNSTVTVLDYKQAPAGCLTDGTRAYFNKHAQAGRDSSFLKSLCRVKGISTLSEAIQMSIYTPIHVPMHMSMHMSIHMFERHLRAARGHH